MDRMKRFFDVYIPTETCNFKCSYCYVSQKGNSSDKIGKIGHEPEEVRRALSINRLGGICFFNFCGGGETLLGEDILPIIYEILKEGHYVQIVTNGTLIKRFEEMFRWSTNILERVFIKFSLHFLELKRQNLLDQYFNNIIEMQKRGASFTIELMPHDELVPFIDEIKDICMKKTGALPHLTVGRDDTSKEMKLLSKYSIEEYKDIWGQFHSSMFDFKIEMFGKERREYCYAGEWSCSLRIDTGDLFQCNGCQKIDNIYANINEPLKYIPVGRNCPHPHCYNCHAYMAMGVFPQIDTPTYANMRDRIMVDGRHWLSPKIYSFFDQKFSQNNVVYNAKKERSRVLLIGDSIREGYGAIVKRELQGKAEVVEIPENARFAAYTLRMISDWCKQLKIGTDIDLVYWNNGLWDVVRICGDNPQTLLADYIGCLKRIIHRIKYLCPNAIIIFANTTPVLEYKNDDKMYERRNSDIEMYNSEAAGVMDKYHINVDDLYTVVNGLSEDNYADWVHLNEIGNTYLGNHIAKYILSALKENASAM